jgi:hypothetical protein
MFKLLRLLIAALVSLTIVPLMAANANILITVDKTVQRMTVTVDGEPRWTWPVSTGRAGHATPSGSYTAFRMEADHHSKEWDEAPMPHSIFFTVKGHAIHGSYDRRHLGSAASHGCVRLSPANAATLFALVRKKGMSNTQVVVVEQQRTGAFASARRITSREQLDVPNQTLSLQPSLGQPSNDFSLYSPGGISFGSQ